MPTYTGQHADRASAQPSTTRNPESAGTATRSDPRPAPEVTWPVAMLEADPLAAAASFDRAINALARRLSPSEAARFLFALDSALYSRLGVAAIRAEADRADGLHPKHRLTRYHDFFLERITAGERVADLGCGLGVLATAIARHCGAHVIGIDMSAPNIEAARVHTVALGVPVDPSTNERSAQGAHGWVAYVVADILDVAAGKPCPGLNEAVDTIVLSNVLEHLPRRSEVLRSLVARLGASRVLIRVPAFERDWRVPYKHELGVEWRLDPTHEVEHTRDELTTEITQAGLRIDSMHQQWGEYYVVALAGG